MSSQFFSNEFNEFVLATAKKLNGNVTHSDGCSAKIIMPSGVPIHATNKSSKLKTTSKPTFKISFEVLDPLYRDKKPPKKGDVYSHSHHFNLGGIAGCVRGIRHIDSHATRISMAKMKCEPTEHDIKIVNLINTMDLFSLSAGRFRLVNKPQNNEPPQLIIPINKLSHLSEQDLNEKLTAIAKILGQ